jgi:hypothetical protein
VSWYEAAAYAAFAGTRLPTIHQWLHAHAIPQTSDILRVSNFSGEGPARVGSYAGLSPFGSYDMAGNVREWAGTPPRRRVAPAATSSARPGASPRTASPVPTSRVRGIAPRTTGFARCAIRVRPTAPSRRPSREFSAIPRACSRSPTTSSRRTGGSIPTSAPPSIPSSRRSTIRRCTGDRSGSRSMRPTEASASSRICSCRETPRRPTRRSCTSRAASHASRGRATRWERVPAGSGFGRTLDGRPALLAVRLRRV